MKLSKIFAATTLALGVASVAQAQVTLYGVVDVGVAYQSVNPGDNSGNGENKSQFGMASGQQSGSRWGLKGVEDLGNGLSANFVYESAVNVANGTSTGFTRQSTLGLASKKYGALDLGRRTTPTTVAFSGIDPFGQSFGTASLDSSMGSTFMRLSNMVMYTSPTFSGFSGSIGYSFDAGQDVYGTPEGESFGTSNKTRAASLGLRYGNGPLLVAFAYDQIMPADVAGKASANVKSWNLGSTYDFKVAKLHAAYGQSIDGLIEGTSVLSNANLSGGDTNTNGGTLFYPGARTQSWMLGVSAPVGAATSVFGSVQQMLPGGDFKTVLNTSTQTVASVGATYSLSKRTNVYAYYSYMDNVAMLSGATSSTLGVGMRHLF
jgi:general bacterial porin, GBP family